MELWKLSSGHFRNLKSLGNVQQHQIVCGKSLKGQCSYEAIGRKAKGIVACSVCSACYAKLQGISRASPGKRPCGLQTAKP